jgi:hypothetical protein
VRRKVSIHTRNCPLRGDSFLESMAISFREAVRWG